MWHIKIINVQQQNMEVAKTEMEKAVDQMATKYGINTSNIPGMSTKQLEMFIIERIMKLFTYEGFENTVNLRLGERTWNEYKHTVHAKYLGQKYDITFIRYNVVVRSTSNVALSEKVKENRPAPAEPIRRVKAEKLPKIQFGLGSDGLRRLKMLANVINSELYVKVPMGKLEVLAVMIETRYKYIPKQTATEKATEDLIRWFKDHTKQRK